jgi:hypothetical protein
VRLLDHDQGPLSGVDHTSKRLLALHIEIVTAEAMNLGEVVSHPLLETRMLDQRPLADLARADDGEDIQISSRLKQEADDLLLLHLPPKHAALHEQVGAVRLPADAGAAAEEHDELLHVTQRSFHAFHRNGQLTCGIAARKQAERPPRRGVRSPTGQDGSPPEGVEDVGARHISPRSWLSCSSIARLVTCRASAFSTTARARSSDRCSLTTSSVEPRSGTC